MAAQNSQKSIITIKILVFLPKIQKSKANLILPASQTQEMMEIRNQTESMIYEYLFVFFDCFPCLFLIRDLGFQVSEKKEERE